VKSLLQHKIRTFHIDINYPDYRGYGKSKPEINTSIFTPSFLQTLNDLVESRNGFLNLHLLTDDPEYHLQEYLGIELGAICFQLDAISDKKQL